MNICETCPRHVEFELVEFKTEQKTPVLEKIEKIKTALSACSFRDILNGHKAKLHKSLISQEAKYHYYDVAAPAELIEAIQNCDGPFIRISDAHDGTGDKWKTRICGADVVRNQMYGAGHRVSAEYLAGDNTAPETDAIAPVEND